ACGLSRCVLGWSILVCAEIYAAVLPDPHVFHHRFFPSLSVTQNFSDLASSAIPVCADWHHESTAWSAMVGGASPLSPPLYRYLARSAFLDAWFLVQPRRLVFK